MYGIFFYLYPPRAERIVSLKFSCKVHPLFFTTCSSDPLVFLRYIYYLLFLVFRLFITFFCNLNSHIYIIPVKSQLFYYYTATFEICDQQALLYILCSPVYSYTLKQTKMQEILQRWSRHTSTVCVCTNKYFVNMKGRDSGEY